MSLDKFQSLLVILTLALGVAGASWSTVWVAPNRRQCQGRSSCRTLQKLGKQKLHMPYPYISKSNTTWVFLPGVHHFPTVDLIQFRHVSNIVLTGDESCVRKKAQCTIECTDHLCVFLFAESRNITIQHLTVVYSNSSYLKVRNHDKISRYIDRFLEIMAALDTNSFQVTITSWMFALTKDVRINSLHLVGYDSRITVYNPRRQFEVFASQFSQLPPATNNSHPKPSLALYIWHSPEIAKTASVTVSGCVFEADHYFPNLNTSDTTQQFHNHHVILVKIAEKLTKIPTHNHQRHRILIKASVTIDNCTFLKTSGVSVHVSDSRFLLATVQVLNSLVDGLAYRRIFYDWGFEHLEGSGVKIQVLTGNSISPHNTKPQMPSSVLVSGNCFRNLASIEGIGVTLQTVYVEHHFSREKLCTCMMPIVIENNIFTDNWGLQHGSIIDATRTWLNGSSIVTDCEHRPFTNPAIVLRNNSFLHSIADLSRCLGFNIAPKGHEHISFRRWNTDKKCKHWEASKGIIHLSGYRESYFAALESNSISSNDVMGICLIDSQVLFNGSNTLTHNYAAHGGGIFVDGTSQMLLMNGTQLHLSQNTAAFTGGGIFASHVSSQLRNILTVREYVQPDSCFYDLVKADGQPMRNITSAADLNVTVTLSDNVASISGSSLFVGSMSPCFGQHILQNPSSEFEVFHTVFHLPSYTDEREMSSLPKKVCSCNSSGLVNCTLSDGPPIQVFPGQSLDLWLMVLGEADIILSGDLTLFISSVSYQNYTHFGMRGTMLLKHNKRLSNGCNKITITGELMVKVTAGDYFIIVSLPTLDNTPFEDKKLNLLASMNMTVLDHCPKGYIMISRGSGQLCKCHSILQDNHITCHFSTLSFGLPPRYWTGTGTDNTSLLFSDSCLSSYCRDTYTSKEVFLSKMTQQCLHGRVGTLCGECPEGQSVVLGSYNCKTCSNYGILVAVGYLVAGPLVIVFIGVFNWTVSARSINGLLLYLNIISINSDLLLRSNSFPFVVISWLNFRVGIEMCLFDGMDEFAKTVLSFAFPLYLISLVVLIVLVSKCINMHRINKLIGRRITPVLATVILLSYTMLSDSVLKSLLFAQLCSSTDGGCTPVWLLDGSLKYFGSTKHIILACMALAILFGLLIPITLTAVIGDLFRRCISNRWYMNFLDTFHSSYRFRWGFWIGLRLVMRIVLLLLKVTVKPEVVWLVTACLSLSLAAVQSLLKPFRHLRFERFTHRLVDEWCSSEENGKTVANYLDISFLVNLTALFVCISYLPDSAEIFISLSLFVALIKLLLILAYHLVEYSPLGPPLLTATTRIVERMGAFCQRMKHTEGQQCEPADNRWLLGLPLVLRAADCTDEDYESTYVTSERETEQSADTH